MLNSSTKKTFDLLNSGPLSAQKNMQKDKALLEEFKSTYRPIFRVYEWEDSFTYGVSQKLESMQHLVKQTQNHAQRMTGGGILFHGNDISYSLIIPISYVENLSVKKSYEVICSFLMTFYRSLGLTPSYAKDLETINLIKNDYCKQGFEPYDIVINGKKIGGNAQRRTKVAIFQHGSISIDSTNESRGYSLEDLGVNIGFKEAKMLLIEAFAHTFNVVFEEKDKDMRNAS